MPSNLFSAGQIGTMTLPNRVIRSATQDPFGHRDGTCAPEQVALYRDIAAAGFATEEQRASQKEVLDAVHEAGGRLILQLMHAGMNVFMPEKHVAGGKLLAPTGGLKAPNDMETTEITAEDMAKIKADFVDAANRFRFPGECLTAIREAVGKDYPVLIKVNTNCGGEYKASYAEDILYFCRQFEALGADAIELSGYNWLGLGKKQVPTFYLDQAKAIRQEVKIPLILVGGVRGPETVQAILDAGIEFVSASRPFICQPDFVKHLEQGEDSPCVGCTKCLGNIWAKEGRRCVKHPIPPEFAQA